MFDTLVMFITLINLFLVVYHHAGYPLVLKWIRGRGENASEKENERRYAANTDDRRLPAVSVVIPAYNEQDYIADKIRNLAVLDYPRNRLKVIVACDGCTDLTADKARQAAAEAACSHLEVEVREFKENRGKIAVLNEVIPSVDSGLVALSDVSALTSVDALLIATGHFEDPKVGVVNGGYRLLKPGSEGEAAYWRYQSNIKAGEAALGSALGSHGAFYMIRRDLFQPLPADTINDDFILPMQIVADGYRAVYELAINALELEQADDSMDRNRRRRIAAGNLQQLLRLKGMLLPKYGGVAFAFASGKALRVLMPFSLLLMLPGSLWLAPGSWFFALMALGQVAVYGISIWYHFARPKLAHKLLKTIYYLVSGHVSGLLGSLGYLTGRYSGRWKRVNAGT